MRVMGPAVPPTGAHFDSDSTMAPTPLTHLQVFPKDIRPLRGLTISITCRTMRVEGRRLMLTNPKPCLFEINIQEIAESFTTPGVGLHDAKH